MKEKLILLMCLIVCLSCKNGDDLQSANDTDDDPTIPTEDGTVNTNGDGTDEVGEQGYSQEMPFSVRIKLKPQTDASYLATEDPEIMALVTKHNVKFEQSYPGFQTPEVLLYYDLTWEGSVSKESRDNALKEFLATGKFEDEVYEYESSTAL